MRDTSGLEMIKTLEQFDLLESLWDQEVIAVTMDGRYHQGKIVCLGCYSQSWGEYTSKFVPSMSIEDSDGIRTYLVVRGDPGVAYIRDSDSDSDLAYDRYEMRPRPTDYPFFVRELAFV